MTLRLAQELNNIFCRGWLHDKGPWSSLSATFLSLFGWNHLCFDNDRYGCIVLVKKRKKKLTFWLNFDGGDKSA